jgi:hypothetical protein
MIRVTRHTDLETPLPDESVLLSSLGSEGPTTHWQIESFGSFTGMRRRRAPNAERSSVPNPDPPQAPMTLDPSRVRAIRDRLAADFYQSGEPAERIAVAVTAALKDLDKSSLPH